MAAGPVGVKHPAKMLFTLAAAMALLAFVMSLIAIFVPWSWKDTNVFERTWVGLWQNCVDVVNSPLNEYTCRMNDVDQIGSVAGGSMKCRGYIVATQVFTIAGVVFAFLTLLTAAMILGKLWSKPVALALYVALMAFLAFSCIMVAFLMWIIYVETNCQPGHPLFPIKNYSWGWILMVCATFFALLAMLLAYLGLFKVMSFKPFIPHEEPPMYPSMMEAAPVYVEQPYYETPAVAYEMPAYQAPMYPQVPVSYPQVSYPAPMMATY